jgi:hypothetical protein
MSIIFFLISALIGIVTIIMSGKRRVFFDLITFRTKKRNHGNVISNKFFMLFVSTAQGTWMWLALCLITGFFITASGAITIFYLPSAWDENSLRWCSLFYDLYSNDFLALSLLFGFFIWFPFSQRIFVPLGKHTSATINCTKSISLHIRVDPKLPDKIIYVRAKTAVKSLLNNHPNKEIILSSWLLAKDAVMPRGADNLRETYSKISNIQHQSKAKFITILLVVTRFISLIAASRNIYKNHKNLGPIQPLPTKFIQLIIKNFPNQKITWHYEKTSFIELILLIAHYPEQLKNSSGYNGVVKISPSDCV